MVITKHDVVRKKLNFAGCDDEQQGASAKLRPRKNTVLPKKDVVNLGRMSSASFMNMIGEAPSQTTVSNAKEFKKTKKSEEQLRTHMLVNLNENILNTDSVDIEEENGNGITESSVPSLDDKSNEETNVNMTEENTSKESEKVLDKVMEKTDKVLDKVKDKTDKVLDNKVIEKTGSEKSPDNRPIPIQDEVRLDDTMPVSVNADSQTEPCYMLCTCTSCKDLVRRFSFYINRGYSEACVGGKSTGQEQNDSRLSMNISNTKDDEEERVPLFKGSQIKISVTAKGKLKCLDRDATASPKDFIYVIMDDLFLPTVMANMTAAGRTKGSARMDPKIKDGMQIYLHNKFDGIDDITKFINAKCYAERRKLWGKSDESVRKPLAKNVKKLSEGHEIEKAESNKEKKKKDKSSEVKKYRHRSKDDSKKSKPAREIEEKARHDGKKKRKAEDNTLPDNVHTPKKGKSSKAPVKRKHQHHGKRTPLQKYRRAPFSPLHPNRKRKRSPSPKERSTVGLKRPRPVEDILQISRKEIRDFERNIPKADSEKSRKQAGTKGAGPSTHEISFDEEFGNTLESSTPYTKKAEQSSHDQSEADSSAEEDESQGEEEEVEDEEEEEEEGQTLSGSDDEED